MLGLCLFALVTGQACVDDEVRGKSAKLLLLESPDMVFAPGESVRVTFQATDEVGTGVPDQRLEVIVSDLTRLRFRAQPDEARTLMLTGKSVQVGGVTLVGGAVVELEVPPSAQPGSVVVVASLEGDRGAASKTRWLEIEIGEPQAGGGAGGGAGTGGESIGGAAIGGAGGSGGSLGGGSPGGGAAAGGAAGGGLGGEFTRGAAPLGGQGGAEGQESE